jgi:hypothetical protein
MITDYALALVCSFFAFSIHRRGVGGRASLWAAAFSVTAFAALAGGTFHGLRALLGEHAALLWRITSVSIALGAALLIAAGVFSAALPGASGEKARRDGLLWIRRAVLSSLAGLAVLILKLSPHPSFNHNDLYHMIQMGGLYCLYRGALLLNRSRGFAP